MMMLRFNMRIPSTRVLGFGTRCVFWTQGCSKVPPCVGCIGDSARSPDGGISISAEEMADWILHLSGIDGLTISGGEPFDQADAVAETIRLVRMKKGFDFSVIVYSGHTLEELQKRAETDAGAAALLAQTDILIDGPYVDALNDNLPYRGSSNQGIRVLNESLRAIAETYYVQVPGRRIEYYFDSEQTILVGVPSLSQAENWKNIKESLLKPTSQTESGRSEA